VKRSTLILFVDAIAFFGFLFLTSSGVLLHFLLPPGSGGWSSIWGLNRHDWGDIHFYVAMIFFGVLTLHLIIHWRVLLNMLKGRHHEGSTIRLALGLVGLITLLLVALAPLLATTHIDEDKARQGRGQYRLDK
jgi:hypothetical protein